MRFENKVALIVGGNSGIGLAAAQGIAREGGHVFITGRSPRTLGEAEASIPGARAFQADMADITSLGGAIQAIRDAHGRIDALLVNAGVGGFASVRDATAAMWDDIHNINLRGAFFTMQQALPLMGKGGAIVFTGSIGGALGLAGNTIYAAAKAGLRAVVRNAATELVGDGIRVNMVSPGPTETPIINRNPGMDVAAVEGLRAMMTNAVPMKRLGEAEEIARAMLFLASDEASFITGVDLFVDGGCVELRG